MVDWIVKNPRYDDAQKEQWETPSIEDFETEEDYYNVHMLWAKEEHEGVYDVALPVARHEDGTIVLVYEALNSAYDFASRVEGLSEEQVSDVREKLENLRENEFPDEEPLDADESEEDEETDSEKGFDEVQKVRDDPVGYTGNY